MFNNARLKLTAWYLLVIMIVSLGFSLVIFQFSAQEISRFESAQRFRYERRLPAVFSPGSVTFPTTEEVQELLEESKWRVFWVLVSANFGILLTSGLLGYFLAGKTLSPIEKMVEDQNRFIGDASHELKTPLTSLKSAFEVYLRDKKPTLPEAKQMVKESIFEVEKLQFLSESLLRLAQFQKPIKDLRMEKISLETVIFEALRKVAPLAQKKEVEIKNEAENLPSAVSVWGLKEDLISLLVILLDNAIKYSHDRGLISVRVVKKERLVTVSVLDFGIGIESKDLPHVFERFFRADAARSKTGENGYGLGLAIAFAIAKAHNGSVHATSLPGKGSTFSVSLPVFS